jgi:hypothetical protein
VCEILSAKVVLCNSFPVLLHPASVSPANHSPSPPENCPSPESKVAFWGCGWDMSLNERRFLTGATLTPAGRLKESGSPNRPYFTPFQPIMKRVLSYVPAGKGHFFFGLDRPFSEYATGLYATLKGNDSHPYQERFEGIAFPLAKETPALQAADLLVYLTYSHMFERLKARNWYINPPQVVKLLHQNLRNREDLCYQDETCLRDTLKKIPTVQLGDLLVDDLAL